MVSCFFNIARAGRRRRAGLRDARTNPPNRAQVLILNRDRVLIFCDARTAATRPAPRRAARAFSCAVRRDANVANRGALHKARRKRARAAANLSIGGDLGVSSSCQARHSKIHLGEVRRSSQKRPALHGSTVPRQRAALQQTYSNGFGDSFDLAHVARRGSQRRQRRDQMQECEWTTSSVTAPSSTTSSLRSSASALPPGKLNQQGRGREVGHVQHRRTRSRCQTSVGARRTATRAARETSERVPWPRSWTRRPPIPRPRARR